MRQLIFLFVCLSVSGASFAYCAGGKYPNISVRQELRQSDFVIVGKLVASRNVVDPIEDPQGVEAQLFQVQIKKVIHGKPPAYALKTYFTLYNENTSGRFWIDEHDVGKEYLMFIQSGADGFSISACGNSDELSKSDQKLRLIERLTRGNRSIIAGSGRVGRFPARAFNAR